MGEYEVKAEFAYDPNGNVRSMWGIYGNATLTYNRQNLPLQRTSGGAVTNYRYDSAGLRVAEITGTTANDTYYIRGLGGAVLAAYNGSGVARYHNILGPYGRVMGRREGAAKRLYVTDHLGTTRAVLSETGTVVESRDYDPYGLEMNGRGWVSGAATKEGFTGHHYDRSTGLVYAGARYYLPGIGRWMAVDPLASEFPGWSPYNYGYNNPHRFVDPDGRAPGPVVGAIAGGAIGGGVELWRQRRECGEVDWGRVGAATGRGAVMGAVAGATGGMSLIQSGTTLAGAEVLTGAAERRVNGEAVLDGRDILSDFVGGAAGGSAASIIGRAVRPDGAGKPIIEGARNLFSRSSNRTVRETGSTVVNAVSDRAPAAARASAEAVTRETVARILRRGEQ
jgi:RHS repeat-associated protein